MMNEVEVIPIAINQNHYNLHIAKLVEHLLYIDSKINPSTVEAQ